MNLNHRQQLLLVIAAAALALLLGDRLVYSPLATGWKSRSERLATLRRSVSRGSVLIGDEKSIRERWDGMRTNTLPNEMSLAESTMLKAFDRWSRDAGVSVSAIRPQWKRPDDRCLTLECRADVSGNLSTLTRFLYQVEKDPLAVKVESAEIAARDTGGEQLTLGLQVSGLLLNPPPP